jgi:hypothetical protein
MNTLLIEDLDLFITDGKFYEERYDSQRKELADYGHNSIPDLGNCSVLLSA